MLVVDRRLASQKHHRNSPGFCDLLQAVRISFNRRCPIMPKAIRFNQLGGPEVLHIEDQPERQPGPGEVLLKVEAVGLNRAESLYYRGSYLEKVNVPSGIGYEALGKVIAVGPEVDPVLIGKRFGTIPGFSMGQYPVLAEEAVVPASVLAAVPDSFSAD
jgi:NADPH:quinone reductase-like Zn-dependent oxidoreductase